MAKNKLTRLLTNKYFILSLILAIGAFLRLYHLTGKSLWYDEACSLNIAAYNWWDILFNYNTITPIPKPVYFVLLKLWTALFGYTEFAARLLSVIFGVLAIVLIYKLAKMLFGVSTGLISAFILSVSSYNIYYSQQARYYTMFLCLSLLSMILFLKVFKGDNFRLRVAYILTISLMLYTFPIGTYILIMQNIFFIIFKNRTKQRRKWLRMQIILAIISLPLLIIPVIDSRYANYDEKFAISRPTPQNLIETLNVFSYGGFKQGAAGMGFEIESSRLRIPRLLTFLFCFIFILSIFYREKKFLQDTDLLRHKDKILLLWLWLFITLFGFYLFSILFKPIFLTRYFIAVAPAFYIAIGYSIYRMKKIKPILILIITILTCFSLNILYYPGYKNGWRSVADSLKYRIQKNDFIVFAPLMQIIPFWYYYKYDQIKNFNNNIDNYGEKFYHRKNCRIFDGSNTILGFGLREDSDHISRELGFLPYNKTNTWLIISPYWIGKGPSEFIKGFFKHGYSVKYKKYFEYDGVEVICYSPS